MDNSRNLGFQMASAFIRENLLIMDIESPPQKTAEEWKKEGN